MQVAKPLFASLLLVAACGLISEPSWSQDENANADTVVLQGVTIHSMTGQAPIEGSVLVKDGKIAAVGAKVKAPANAKVLKLDGHHLTPGLIESRGKLWLTAPSIAQAGTRADLDILDGVDPWSQDWRELAAQGITSVYVQPASSSSLGGFGSVLRVGPMSSVDELTLKKHVGLQAALGTRGATSKDRYAQYKALEKLLETAKKEIDKEKDKDKPPTPRSKTAAAKKSDKPESEKEQPDKKPASQDDDSKKDDEKKSAEDKSNDKKEQTDPVKKALIQVLKKEVPLFLEVHHSDSLMHALALAKKYEFRLVLDGLSKINGSSEALSESGAPMVVGPFFESGTAPAYRKDAKWDWLEGRLQDSAVSWSIGGFARNGLESRLLRIQAARARQLGASQESALAAVTANAARMLGVADQVGTIEVGKQADLAVFAGDPLNPASQVALVMCGGVVTHQQTTEAQPGSSWSESSEETPEQLPKSYIIKTQHLMQEDGSFAAGQLAVSEGKIVAIDDAEKDWPLIDVGDRYVSPGLVNAHTSMGQAANIGDTSESDVSHLRAVDAIDLGHSEAQKLLAAGFIHAGISPGLSTTSPGVLGHVRLGSSQGVAEPLAAGQFVLTATARSNDRYPASLNAQVSLLRGLFAGRTLPSTLYLSEGVAATIESAKLENVAQTREGKRKSIVVANSDLELDAALQLAADQQLSGAIATNGRPAKYLARWTEQSMGVLILSFNGNEFNQQVQEYVSLAKAGVPVALGGESPDRIRMTATMLCSAGVPADQMMASLTTGAANLLGMQPVDLKAGQPADLVVWDGHPLNLATQPAAVVVDGRRVPQP